MGAPLSYVDNGDGTFTDLVTGRMWEIKIAGGSGSGSCLTVLHGVDSTCTWAQATGDWINAINAEGGTGYAGYNDWRVPNVRELQSLIDYSVVNPATSFPGLVAASFYWSSTPFAFNPLFAWLVSFGFGSVTIDNKTFGIRVRAVRGGS